MSYRVELKPAAARQLSAIEKPAQRKIAAKIESLAKDPFPHDAKNISGKEDFFRVRSGDYRIVYKVKKKILLVLVIKIGHRRDIYRRLSGIV